MYLHSSNYDQSCALANTVVPTNIFVLANTMFQEAQAMIALTMIAPTNTLKHSSSANEL
jgi:hypothetical protein